MLLQNSQVQKEHADVPDEFEKQIAMKTHVIYPEGVQILRNKHKRKILQWKLGKFPGRCKSDPSNSIPPIANRLWQGPGPSKSHCILLDNFTTTSWQISVHYQRNFGDVLCPCEQKQRQPIRYGNSEIWKLLTLLNNTCTLTCNSPMYEGHSKNS